MALSRRALIPALAGLAAAGGAFVPLPGVANPSADAELIAVCAALNAVERQRQTVWGETGTPGALPDDEAEAAAVPLYDRMHVLLDRMERLRATTTAGIQARAHSLAVYEEYTDDGRGEVVHDLSAGDTISGRLARYLLRDAMALASGTAPAVEPPPSPDAELLAACEAFMVLERKAGALYEPRCATIEEEDARLPGIEAAVEVIAAEQEPLLARMVALRPHTLEGARARARALALLDEDAGAVTEGDFWNHQLAGAVVRDLIGNSHPAA